MPFEAEDDFVAELLAAVSLHLLLSLPLSPFCLVEAVTTDEAWADLKYFANEVS